MATPVISVDDIVVSEADTTAFFTVNLSESSATTVTVAFSLSNVTALNGSDYVATSGTLSFAPGQTTLTIPVTLINNAVAEPIEIVPPEPVQSHQCLDREHGRERSDHRQRCALGHAGGVDQRFHGR